MRCARIKVPFLERRRRRRFTIFSSNGGMSQWLGREENEDGDDLAREGEDMPAASYFRSRNASVPLRAAWQFRSEERGMRGSAPATSTVRIADGGTGGENKRRNSIGRGEDRERNKSPPLA